MTDLIHRIFEALLRWLIPGRGRHRVANGPTTGTSWRVPMPEEARRRLVRVRRVPPGLLVLCSADAHPVRPYVLSGDEWRAAKRARMEASVRQLNKWSSGGGGRC